MKEVKVKIKLKRRHPANMMYHGRHVVEPHFKTLGFNADEMESLGGSGPQHWFEYTIIRRLKEDERIELQELKEAQAAESAEQKRKLMAKVKEQQELEELRLKELTNKELIKQGV